MRNIGVGVVVGIVSIAAYVRLSINHTYSRAPTCVRACASLRVAILVASSSRQEVSHDTACNSDR